MLHDSLIAGGRIKDFVVYHYDRVEHFEEDNCMAAASDLEGW